MAGIDNITNEILQDAKTKADGIIADANAKAKAVTDDADEKAAAYLKQADEKAAADTARTRERTASAAQMRARETKLAAKQQVIDEVIEKAYEKLDSQESSAYFAMIEKLLEGAVSAGEGIICFGARDLERLPADFEKKAAAVGKKKGAVLRVSSTPEKIENGFILKYGGIEENCTLRALFAQKRDELRDRVNGILW